MQNRFEDLPISLQKHIDTICDEFEENWGTDQPLSIESCLQNIELGKTELLVQLVKLEFELTCSNGQSISLDDFQQRFASFEIDWQDIFGNSSDALQNTPEKISSSNLQPTEDDESFFAPGDLIGKYRVLRQLGSGGFAIVYLAHHPELKIDVAIKVPRRSSFCSTSDIETFLEDARHAARLKHPGIVTVHDVGQQAGVPFIVQEFLAGGDLKQALEKRTFTAEEIVAIMAAISDAVAYSHDKGVIHRDLKPGNILLDDQGFPRVADFGLALNSRSASLLKNEICGTPAYMSPEQLGGEQHRIDLRTDIWSLGVILYEFLAGRRPFFGETDLTLFRAIRDSEIQPLLEIRPGTSPELERICLICLRRKRNDRYKNASQLADDLRDWQTTDNYSRLRSPHEQAAVMPKGLKSFDATDSDFFLRLLPGPFDREGLPNIIRHWKTRIEQTDVQLDPFAVGLIYGPSGCGKTSVVKAGILPRLAPHIVPIYVEATAEDTEVRILKQLRALIPKLPANLSLPNVLATLRDENWLPEGQKLLLILDQFEQWLNKSHLRSSKQLVAALRHFDGVNLQCLVLVHTDFWHTTARFMSDLEVPLIQDTNSTLIDLFELSHSKQVLIAFGRAYGRLENSGQLTKYQRSFVDQAIDGLATQGKVVCVRLALFADMFKDRPWTPSELKKVGGAEGIGTTFLKETFNTTSPKHLAHKAAAQACLESLLPDDGRANLKGHMMSRDALQKSSGYQDDTAKFQDLLNILEIELKLITPTDPLGSETTPAHNAPSDHARYYQLTHDFLVKPIRTWIRSELTESFSGRSMIQLAVQTDVWSANQKNRKYLPTWGEFVRFRFFSPRPFWTQTQHAMMRSAAMIHGTLTLCVFFLLASAGVASYVAYCKIQASNLVQNLRNSATPNVQVALDALLPYQYWANPLLQNDLAQLESTVPLDEQDQQSTQRQTLHFQMALAHLDQQVLNSVWQSVYQVAPEHISTVANFLKPFRKQLLPALLSSLNASDVVSSEETKREAIIAAYWGRPEYLIRLIGEVPASELPRFIAALRTDTSQSVSLLTSILEDEPPPPLANVSPELTQVFSKISGNITSSGGLALGVPLVDTAQVLSRTEEGGYFPTSFRPYTTPEGILVAISWRKQFLDRDKITNSHVAYGLSSDELIAQDAECTSRGLGIYDISHYATQLTDGTVSDRYAGLWLDSNTSPRTTFNLSLSLEEFETQRRSLSRDSRQIHRLFTQVDASGRPLFSVIWQSVIPGEQPELAPKPTYRFSTNAGDFWPGAIQVDSRLAHLDLSKPYYFDKHIEANKKRLDLDLVAGDFAKFQPKKLLEISALADTLGSLGEPKLALQLLSPQLANLEKQTLLDSDPKQRIAELRSLRQSLAFAYWNQGDPAALSDAIEHFDATPTRGNVALASLRLREAILTQDTTSAKTQIDYIHREIEKAAPKLRPLYLYPVALSNALLAQFAADKEYATSLRLSAIKLVEESPSQRIVRNVLRNSDFDAIRNALEIQKLFLLHGFEFRQTLAWRHSRQNETVQIASKNANEHMFDSLQMLRAGYAPSSVSARYSQQAKSVVATSVWSKQAVPGLVKEKAAIRNANVCMVLSQLGRVTALRDAMSGKHGDAIRNEIICRLSQSTFLPHELVVDLSTHPSQKYVSAVLAAVGEFEYSKIAPQTQSTLDKEMNQIEDKAASLSPELVNSLSWCLRSWGTFTSAPTREPTGKHDSWFTDEMNQTMVVIKPPKTTLMGSPFHEHQHGISEKQHWVEINRTYALADTEVTVRQFQLFLDDPEVKALYAETPFQFERRHAPEIDCPQISVRWLDAARFCNWWSKQNSIPQDQWCYPGVMNKTFDTEQYRPPDDSITRAGYRLPTEAEWEHAARGGSALARYFGESVAHLDQSSWHAGNSEDRTHPVGSWRPNGYGLFDMLGNASEWCHDDYRTYLAPKLGTHFVDTGAPTKSGKSTIRVLRGGSFASFSRYLRSADRMTANPKTRSIFIGFRLAKTLPNASEEP